MVFNPKKFEEKTISREEIFNGKIFQVARDSVSLPDATESFRELVYHNGGVAIVPIHENKLILVGQYRKAIEKFIYEIPAGKLEIGENTDPMAAGLRELEEETGFSSSKLIEMPAFYGAVGFSNEISYMYFTDDLAKVENPRPKDVGEFLEQIEVTLEQARAMIGRGEICDAKTLLAVDYWEIKTLKEGQNHA